jgi:hypothetical protein
MQVKKQHQTSTKRNYSGYHLKDTGGHVRIDASYAGITFEQK